MKADMMEKLLAAGSEKELRAVTEEYGYHLSSEKFTELVSRIRNVKGLSDDDLADAAGGFVIEADRRNYAAQTGRPYMGRYYFRDGTSMTIAEKRAADAKKAADGAAAAEAARLKAEEEAAKAAEYAAITAIFSRPGAPFEEAAPIQIV